MPAVKEYVLERLVEDTNSTGGKWCDAVTGKQIAGILERGATMDHLPEHDRHPRIHAGRYRLRFKTDGSKFDVRYAARFPWFRHMIEIAGVPGRGEILIHTGNKFTESLGCLLTTTEPPGILPTERGYEIQAGASLPAFETLYRQIYAALDAGEAWVTIKDIGDA